MTNREKNKILFLNPISVGVLENQNMLGGGSIWPVTAKKLFFWLQYDFIQKSPLTSENAWFTILGFSFPRIYFLQDLFSWDLISWDFIGSPHTILGKKVPGIQNTGLYFQWHFFQGLDKIQTFFQSFYFRVFFPETFFPGTFLHRFSLPPPPSKSHVLCPNMTNDTSLFTQFLTLKYLILLKNIKINCPHNTVQIDVLRIKPTVLNDTNSVIRKHFSTNFTVQYKPSQTK